MANVKYSSPLLWNFYFYKKEYYMATKQTLYEGIYLRMYSWPRVTGFASKPVVNFT